MVGVEQRGHTSDRFVRMKIIWTSEVPERTYGTEVTARILAQRWWGKFLLHPQVASRATTCRMVHTWKIPHTQTLDRG
jgi:hypothetical protein